MPTRSASCAASTRRPLSPTLALEPVEHLIEGAHDASDFVVSCDREALAGAKEIDRLHPLSQPLKRRDHPPQEQRVRRHRDYEPRQNYDHLNRPYGVADLHGAGDQQNRDRNQQARVDGQDPPEEVEWAAHCPRR